MSRHERFEQEPDPTWDAVWTIIGQGMMPPDETSQDEPDGPQLVCCVCGAAPPLVSFAPPLCKTCRWVTAGFGK